VKAHVLIDNYVNILIERLNEGLCPSMRAYRVALPYAASRRVEVPVTTPRRFPAALLLMGLLLLSACGGNEPPTTGSRVAPTGTAAPGGTAKAAAPAASSDGSAAALKFDPASYRKNAIEPGAQLRVSSWGDASEQKVNRDSLARFNQVYPDVKITYEPQPSDYGTKLLAEIKSGSPPDVFSLNVDLPYQLIPNKVLLDLTPALTEVGRSKEDYFPNLTDVFLGKDGKIYGLPKDFTTMVLFYNTDMVKTPPKPGWTQDDFTAWIKKNTSGSGETQVFGLATDLVFFPYWGNFALANGAKVIGDNGNCAINSPAGVATLDWLYGLYKDKFLTVSSDVGATWEGEAFAKKGAASIVVGGWVNPFLNDPSAAFGIHYDAVPLPVGKTRAPATMVGFAGWGAAAQSKYPKAAAALLLFLTSRENERAILQTGFALPSLKGMENDPFFKGSSTLSKISKLLYEGASYGVPGVWGGEANTKIQKALNDATERVFAGAQTGQQALDEACQEIDDALSGH
jgi:multiple sugar transport system substrate-binding protein